MLTKQETVLGRGMAREKEGRRTQAKGKRKRRRLMMEWLNGITISIGMKLSKLGDSGGQRTLACCSSQAT